MRILFSAAVNAPAEIDTHKKPKLRYFAPVLFTLLGTPAFSQPSPVEGSGDTVQLTQTQTHTGSIPAHLPRYRAITTVFCPEDPTVDRGMQGGMRDRRGNSIRGKSLQDYLEGRGDYVAVAMDLHAFPYGTILRIPELDAHYGRPIVFKVVGTGGAFRGKGTSRIDIMTRSLRESQPVAGHMRVTLIPVHIPG